MRRRSSSLKIALEALHSPTDVVEFQGALGLAYTRALNQAYTKNALLGMDDTTRPLEGETGSDAGELAPEVAEQQLADASQIELQAPSAALESQAIDALTAGQIAADDTTSPTNIVAYAVDKNGVTTDDIVNVSSAMDEDEDDKEFVLIIDGTGTGENAQNETNAEPKLVDLSGALEAIARQHNKRVFPSIESFLNRSR